MALAGLKVGELPEYPISSQDLIIVAHFIENAYVYSKGTPQSFSPVIGENGNWFVLGQDTGVKAQGPQGAAASPLMMQWSSDNSNWHSQPQAGDVWRRYSFDEGVTWTDGENTTNVSNADNATMASSSGISLLPTNSDIFSIADQQVRSTTKQYLGNDVTNAPNTGFFYFTISSNSGYGWEHITAISYGAGNTPNEIWHSQRSGTGDFMAWVKLALSPIDAISLKFLDAGSDIFQIANDQDNGTVKFYAGAGIVNGPVGGYLYFKITTHTAGGWQHIEAYTFGISNTINQVYHNQRYDTQYWSGWINISGNSPWIQGNITTSEPSPITARFKQLDSNTLILDVKLSEGYGYSSGAQYTITNMPMVKEKSMAIPATPVSGGFVGGDPYFTLNNNFIYFEAGFNLGYGTDTTFTFILELQ